MTGSLNGPLARIKVDEKNCFGMIEWKAAREAASRFQPKAHSNKKGSRQCRRIEVQSKETSMAPGVQPGLRDGGGRNARKQSGAYPPLDWRGRSCRATVSANRPRSQNAGVSQLPGWRTRKAHRCPRPAARAARKAEGLADLWYMDDGDTVCVTHILVLPFLQDFDVVNARVGAERNPLKTEVILHVNDLDAAPPKWRIGDMRKMAKTSTVTDGSITLGVAVGSRQFIANKLLGKADVHPSDARRLF